MSDLTGALYAIKSINLLMEHKGLRQGVASDVLNGRREISKAHARKLADYFQLPAERPQGLGVCRKQAWRR